MHAEIKSIGSKGSYAVDLFIGNETFRMRYFAAHRVDPQRDAQEFAATLGEAIKREERQEAGRDACAPSEI
jgi:hypothetical protein